MQFFRPPAVPPSSSSSSFGSKSTAFGQDRAQSMQQRLDASIKERQRLAMAQQTASAPLDQHLKQKGELVGRRIAQLQDATK